MNSTTIDRLDPYRYSSGRWLRCDKLERDCRHLSFDFDALCRRVIDICPGASSIATYDKKEGGFNRVFIFTTDNAKRVVAKLPFPLAGPPRLLTNSEVATIEYLQANTAIPIPKILDWNDDASNSIGCEYIIMEHAAGVQLRQRWPTMPGDKQIRCIDSIYRKLKEIGDLEFPAYGSLYHVNNPVRSPSQIPLDKDFCVGAHCGARYWDCNTGEPRFYHNTRPNQGPWPDLIAYSDGLIDSGISRIPPVDSQARDRPSYHGSTEAHLSLLASGRALLKTMSTDSRIRDSAVPLLFHPDLHTRNIFVSDDDPAIVTGIIDWQSSSVEPAFWYGDDVPDFAKPVAVSTDVNKFDPQSERCAKAFNVCNQYFMPKLAGPRLMDEALFRPFRYCYRTWKDGAVAFRHELIETSRSWKELGFSGVCPFPMPSSKELAIHQKEYKKFEAAHHLRRDLADLLNVATDGWVPVEDWEATKLAHKETFDGMLQAVLTYEDPNHEEPIKDERDLREIWPFDL